MQPLGTKVYLLKRYSPSDSFCTFFYESVQEEILNALNAEDVIATTRRALTATSDASMPSQSLMFPGFHLI